MTKLLEISCPIKVFNLIQWLVSERLKFTAFTRERLCHRGLPWITTLLKSLQPDLPRLERACHLPLLVRNRCSQIREFATGRATLDGRWFLLVLRGLSKDAPPYHQVSERDLIGNKDTQLLKGTRCCQRA